MVRGPEPGDHLLVAGMTKSGKTAFVVRMLLNNNSPFNNVIIFCARCSAEQPAYKKMKDHFKTNFILKVGLPETTDEVDEIMDKLRKDFKNGLKTAVVIDDLVLSQKGVGGAFVRDMFLGARHLNTSVVMISQAPSASDRFTRLQTSIFVLFKCGLADGIAALARQLHPESRGKRIMQMYRHCLRRAHGHLIIDTRSSDLTQFRDSSWNCAVEKY